MKRTTSVILASVAGLLLFGGFARAAHAAEAPTCPMPTGWYANPDEQDNLPEPTAAGLRFEGKDLIHHATSPIDLADMDHVTAGFDATMDGKVVFKVETSAPYSTIITNADGKVWSTAMTYDQEGGQGHPVAHYSDLVGKDTKPGKAHFDTSSRVVTFGVGYWVEPGETVVSQIKFHGTTYDLTCTPPTTTPTTDPTTKPPTKPTTAPPSHSPSASPSASVPPVIGGADPSLPVTGPNLLLIASTGLGLLIAGAGAVFFSRRRRFTA